MTKAMRRLCMALVVAISLAAQSAFAQVPGDGKGKASLRLLEKMASGASSQDFIVVFDDKEIQKEAKVLKLEMGLASHHQRIVEHKAARFAEKKRQSLSDFGSHEAEVLKDYSHLPLGFVRIHSRDALDKLLAHPGVVGVYENRIKRLALAESLPLIGQSQVAAQGNLGAGTAVAVLDAGVDYTQPAFGSCTSPGVPVNCKVAYAHDFAPGDAGRHGTNVASIVVGTAPGTKIVDLKVFGAATTSDSTIIDAINWVVANRSTHNIVAINLSLGGDKFTSPVTSGLYKVAVDQARAAGILLIASAGNEGYTNALASPAAVQGVVSVGAVYDSTMGALNWGNPLRCSDTTTTADKVPCFSNSASFLTLLAPGSQILAGGITMGGTSQAAPHVAGAVAVLRAAFPGETLDQTVARLKNGVTVTDSRNDIAKPRLNLTMALGLSASCTYSISETGKSYNSNSSGGSIAVTTGAGCTWVAASNTSNASWLTVTSGNSGSGNGTVTYAVSANPNTASRTGALTVAGKTYTVTQSGSVGAVSNILRNSGFEDGPVSWTENTANGLPVITAYLNPPATNSWYGWLCGYDNCVDTLHQDVIVPADAQSAFVQFNYWIRTDEPSNVTAYDSMAVSIYSPPNASTSTYWTLSNLNSTTGWVPSPQYDVSAFRGQTIRLQFSAATDTSLVTDFFVDDVTLMVSGSTPDTQSPTVPTGLTATTVSTSAIDLAWSAATDNVGVAVYKIYRDGVLLATPGNLTGYDDTGLATGTSYSYTVSACDAAGNCSPQSAAAIALTAQTLSDTQAPTVPTGLTATAISTSGINLSWAASSDNVGVTKYKVYRSGTLLATPGNATSYADTGLTPSTDYSYTVSACDAAGNCSAQSGAKFATTYAPFNQATPIIFEGYTSFQVSGNFVNISVEKITNRSFTRTSGSLRIELWALTAAYSGGAVTGYVTTSVRTNQIPGMSDQMPPNYYYSGITLNQAFTPPPANYTNYALFLLEYDAVNCSTSDHFCIIAYVNYHELQPPTVPAGLTAAAVSSSQINLAWSSATDNVGVATYQVYRGGILIAMLGNVTSYSDIGIAASTLNTYTVAACDAVGNCSRQSSAASATTSAAPDTQPPTIPAGLTASAVSSSQVNLAWSAATDNVGVAAYKIYSSGVLVATLGNVTSASRTNAPSTTYRYTVSACDAVGNCSGQSASASVTTPALSDAEPPTVPTGLTATTVSSSRIDLSWTASSDNVGVTAYKIYSGGSLVSTLGNVTTFGHTGLRDGTTYTYTVTSCDSAGNCSAPSAATAGTTLTSTITLNLNAGWNLLGNSYTGSIDVASFIGDTTKVSTVWKWNANSAKWAFYAPSLVRQALADYAIGKGYDVLTTINGGEGFWVNAKTAFAAQLPADTAVTSASFSSMAAGWNLIAVGDNKTPSEFNALVGASTPLTTLWAWDAPGSAWYFYAPSLNSNGGLENYIASKGYLDFTTASKTLGPGVGFWVNKP